MSLVGLTLALALAASPPAPDPARAELDALAERIAELKARRLSGQGSGRELERLLVRAQELAARIERHDPAREVPLATGPGPDELRERADALHDEADRLESALRTLDARILARLGQGAGGAPVLAQAAAPAREQPEVEVLRARRVELAARLAKVRETAAALEAEAALDPHAR